MTLRNESVFLPKLHSYKFIHNLLTGLGDLAETIIILLKFGSLSPNATLKNRSRSYKLNQLLIAYTHISLVKTRQLVQKKPGTQMSANLNADINGIHTKIYLFLLLRGKRTKAHANIRLTVQSIFCDMKKLHLPLIWSISPNFSRKSRSRSTLHLDQPGSHMTIYVMVNLKPCSYELAYV